MMLLSFSNAMQHINLTNTCMIGGFKRFHSHASAYATHKLSPAGMHHAKFIRTGIATTRTMPPQPPPALLPRPLLP